MRNLFRFYGIFVFIGLLFLTVSCAGGGSGDGGISYDDDDSATSSSSSASVFTITYYSDADGISAPSVTKASVGGSVTITTTKPVREGYVFIGWATSSGGTVKYQPGSKVVLKVSITLYAVWKEGTPATYTVRHVMPDGTAADTQSGLTGVSGGNTNATANEYPGYHPSGVPNTSIADDGSTVVNISYAANTYTIAFNTNGGTGGSTASAPAAYGSSISLTPNGFTKTGYSFAGWNTKSDGTGTAYSDKASVSNLTSENGVTITLYAMWKPNTYTVKFDANGGTGSMANMGATYDKAMNLPANAFKRKGFAFSGWGSSADASSPAHSNSESVKNLTADNGVTITLYALWTEGAYSITFNANGGSGTMADQTASSASPTSLSSNGFTRTGYTFAGWATTQSATTAAYSNGQSVSALTDDDAVTLYAVWKANTYTIKFDANGGTGSMGNQSATYDKAAALSANKFSRDGYKFMGWSKTSSATSSDYTGGASVKNLTADNGVTITLYAVWASNTYTISFSANGGTGSMSGQGASLDGSTSLNPNSFSRTGYTFAGWATSASATSPKYTDASSIPALTSELGASVTLYAVWKPNTYTIKFDANGGMGSMGNQSATYDKAAALSTNKFSRSGYKFAGWNTNKNASDSQYAGGASVSNLTADNGATVTLYAVWSENVCKISFDSNGGSGSMGDQTVNAGSSISGNTFTKTGYTFKGWATTPNATTATYTDAQSAAALANGEMTNVTLYAVWAANTYTIKFDSNGGTGSMGDQSATYDKAAALGANKFSKTGYTFAGWATSSSASSATYTNSQSVKNLSSSDGATVTLYANWTANTYTIKFNSNGGTGSMASLTATYDKPSLLTGNGFTRNKYNFIGWSTSSTSNTVVYTDAESVKNITAVNGATVSLYAVWEFEGCVDISSSSVGNIILDNGKTVSPDDFDSNSMKAVAVVAFIKGTTRYGVGLNHADALAWAAGGGGYSKKIADIVCTPSQTNGKKAYFTGDIDGSDNWGYVIASVASTTELFYMDDYYPAFVYADEYGKNNGFAGTDFEEGWYIPSLSELCSINKNASVVNSSILKAGGASLYFGVNGGTYWSSSQSNEGSNVAHVVAFMKNTSSSTDGYINTTTNKSGEFGVLVIRKF